MTSHASGAGEEDVYEPSLFYFDMQIEIPRKGRELRTINRWKKQPLLAQPGYRVSTQRRPLICDRNRCSKLVRLYPRTWRPPEPLWSLYGDRQKHSGVCLAAAKTALESVWRPPD
ncbi:hypothetical protein PoB_002066100 [Plakobranchus ocellatus]|uniref:Uncharacterized protein n=1 Tax=Plakobranchus ocellatus TaxID=259542 RepID=A0AAV3ZE40_9GAST|nr:hypothetical protein PoB_002066100 [Plakobranchus ocellatus]